MANGALIPVADRMSWGLIVAMAVACLLAIDGLGFHVDPGRAMFPAGGLAILAAAVAIGRIGGRPRLEAGATAFLQMTLFTIIGVVLSYALAARAGSLWDDRLAAADRALGFDWPAVFHAADGSAAALWIGGIAYHSLTVQMIVAIVALSGMGKFDTLRTMVCAAILSGFVTILISGLTPAMGNLFDPARYVHLWPSIAWLEQGLISGLRDGSLRVLDLTMLMGIVSFPSFHATLAAIFIWAFGAMPRLAGPGRAWAILTIVATPVFGGHYGVDVLMGLLLAPPAIVAAQRLTQRRQPCPEPGPGVPA